MAKYTLMNDGSYKNNETGATNIRPGVWLFDDVREWLAQGNIPDPEFTQEQIDEQTFQDQLQALDSTMQGELIQPCIVEINGVTYTMDGREDSASRCKAGIDLAQLLGETTIDLVDYNNEVIKNVPIADALEVCKAQAVHYRNSYYKRANARDVLIKNRS